MSNFENDNLNNNQNMGNTNFNNQNNPNQNIGNMNFNNNQNIVNDPKIASEVNQIKVIKGLVIAISIISLIGAICCIYYYSTFMNGTGHYIYSDTAEFYSFIKTRLIQRIMIFIGIPINIAVLTLGIITLVKKTKIQIIKINKSLVTATAILAIVSIIPLLGLINLAAFIVSLICFFNLKKSLNDLNEQNISN